MVKSPILESDQVEASSLILESDQVEASSQMLNKDEVSEKLVETDVQAKKLSERTSEKMVESTKIYQQDWFAKSCRKQHGVVSNDLQGEAAWKSNKCRKEDVQKHLVLSKVAHPNSVSVHASLLGKRTSICVCKASGSSSGFSSSNKWGSTKSLGSKY